MSDRVKRLAVRHFVLVTHWLWTGCVVTVTAIFVVHMASQSLAWLAMVPGWAALSIFLGGTVEEVAEWADNAWREI